MRNYLKLILVTVTFLYPHGDGDHEHSHSLKSKGIEKENIKKLKVVHYFRIPVKGAVAGAPKNIYSNIQYFHNK